MPRWLPYLLLLGQSLLFFRGVLAETHVIPWDLPAYHLPFSYLAHDALREGDFALWDPYTYCGRPVAANPQAQVFYPPRMVTHVIALWTGVGSLFWLLELLVVFHMWLAGATAYRLARSAGMSTAAAMITGSVFQLGGFMAAHAEHLGAVCVAAWIPLAIESAWKARPVALAGVLAMTVLAGFTPMTLVAWAVAFGFAVRRPRLFGSFAAAGVLALVQLGPALELMQASVAKYRTDWVGEGGIPLAVLWTLVDPNRVPPAGLDITYWFLYCGLVPLGLAVVGAVTRPWLVAMTGAALIIMVGRLPGFVPDLIQRASYPEYASSLVVLGVAGLAGFGLDRLSWPAWTGWLLVAATSADLIVRSSGRPMNATPRDREMVVTRASFPEIRARMGQGPAPGRVESGPGGSLVALTSPITRIHHANGYDPMALEGYLRFRLNYLEGKRWGAYYEVPSADSPLLAETATALLVSGDGTIQEVKAKPPRFRLVYGAVRVVKFGLREVVFETESSREDQLISAEVAYPGWRAWIDGREQAIDIDRGTFRSHWLPAGNHIVVWRFEPLLLYWCGAISLVAWITWAVAWLRWRGPEAA